MVLRPCPVRDSSTLQIPSQFTKEELFDVFNKVSRIFAKTPHLLHRAVDGEKEFLIGWHNDRSLLLLEVMNAKEFSFNSTLRSTLLQHFNGSSIESIQVLMNESYVRSPVELLKEGYCLQNASRGTLFEVDSEERIITIQKMPQGTAFNSKLGSWSDTYNLLSRLLSSTILFKESGNYCLNLQPSSFLIEQDQSFFISEFSHTYYLPDQFSLTERQTIIDHLTLSPFRDKYREFYNQLLGNWHELDEMTFIKLAVYTASFGCYQMKMSDDTDPALREKIEDILDFFREDLISDEQVVKTKYQQLKELLEAQMVHRIGYSFLAILGWKEPCAPDLEKIQSLLQKVEFEEAIAANLIKEMIAPESINLTLCSHVLKGLLSSQEEFVRMTSSFESSFSPFQIDVEQKLLTREEEL